MDLQFDSGRFIGRARESDLVDVADERFATLSDGKAFIQCHMRRNNSPSDYDLEYRDGPEDGHYRATDKQITLDRMLSAFLKYMRGDFSWRADFQWEKLNVT
jgi:hypothetical protein